MRKRKHLPVIRTVHIEISRRMLLQFVTFDRVIMESQMFRRTEVMSINLEIHLNQLQRDTVADTLLSKNDCLTIVISVLCRGL